MICPRMSQPSPQGSVQNLNPVICQEENCAVWLAEEKVCAEVQATILLAEISEALGAIHLSQGK